MYTPSISYQFMNTGGTGVRSSSAERRRLTQTPSSVGQRRNNARHKGTIHKLRTYSHSFLRRLSADNTPKSEGLSLEKIERVSYKETLKSVPANCKDEADTETDTSQCVICLSGQIHRQATATYAQLRVCSNYFSIPAREYFLANFNFYNNMEFNPSSTHSKLYKYTV